MDRWVAHALLITPAAHRAVAAQLYGHATGRAEDSTPDTYSIALTAAGGGEITHYACHTRIRAGTLAALPQLAATIPGALWLVTAHDDDDAEATALRPDVSTWLAEHGLEIHTPEQETQ